MRRIYLGLGSNIGNRTENLRRAISALVPEVTVEKTSHIYETAAIYKADQPNFLNMAVEAATELDAQDVLKKIKSIEKEMGEHEHNGPRVIDIDLLFYGDEIINTPELVVPHPKIAERDFVLKPLCDIAPDFRDPMSGKTVLQLLGELLSGQCSVIGPVPEVS